jgi:hypothetical protein
VDGVGRNGAGVEGELKDATITLKKTQVMPESSRLPEGRDYLINYLNKIAELQASYT